MASYRVGIDIGGTFTDFTVVDGETGQVVIDKTLTTPRSPEEAVMTGLGRLSRELPDLLAHSSEVIHATTLVTNVILERKGARTGLLTTSGFRDVLEMAREVRYDLFDMFIRLPRPLVPRSLRLPIRERMLADGSVHAPLNEEDVREAARRLREQGVTAVAISFLHAYRNPAHELRAAQIVREEMPQAMISMSHAVHPEPKEYERTSTTVVDAYVKAVVEGYLDRLATQLADRGYQRRLLVMLSNGGTATVETAKQVPVQIVESGPAAGVEAAAFFARMMGQERILAFDMGGTTAKLCIVNQGKASRTREFEVDRVHRFRAGSGLPVAVSVYDLLEIGSGGGSIARVNDLGLLQVGPDSASSEPGPVCYGRGGSEPTVTDADLVLGYLDPGYFLGGEMVLDIEAARRAIAERIGAVAGLDLTRAAAGIHEIVDETMAAAARVYVAEKAMAPSELTLFAFGGAGPVHAVGLARKLGCQTVIVPPYSGVISSLGLLAAPVAFERSRSVRRLLAQIDLRALEDDFIQLERHTASQLPDPQQAMLERTVDLRYAGQDYALEIDAEESCRTEGVVKLWSDRYVAAYHELYGKVDDDSPIELASIRVVARQRGPEPHIGPSTAAVPGPVKATRDVYFTAIGRHLPTRVYERDTLQVGQVIEGPALVQERVATTVVEPGDRLTVDRTGCLVIALAPAATGPSDAGAQATTA